MTASPFRAELERHLGDHVFARWENDARTFTDAAAEDLVAEQRLADEYYAVLGAARTPFRGADASLGELARYADHPDRGTRRDAAFAIGALFDENAARLDDVFDGIVRTRAAIAAALGERGFIDVAYRRRGRVDYGASDAARFRDDIRAHVVPLASEIVRRQGEALGVEAVMPWDADLFDGAGPIGVSSPDDQLRELCAALGALDADIGSLASAMVEGDLYDTAERPGKAVGGFCTFFATTGTPFVFATPRRTSADVGTLVHETGHAFQMYSSRAQPVWEHMAPSAETGEISSMALEFLMWPHYERFFGRDAARFRARHLRTMITMLPYIATVDEFQERVYAEPGATPAQRNDMWLETERRYMPCSRHGGIPYLARGARWQRQRHVYAYPFYYIDYGLAMCCALQLWQIAASDPGDALARYRAIAARGGELPFRALVRDAGLASPFEPGTLAAVADAVRRELSAN